MGLVKISLPSFLGNGNTATEIQLVLKLEAGLTYTKGRSCNLRSFTTCRKLAREVRHVSFCHLPKFNK